MRAIKPVSQLFSAILLAVLFSAVLSARTTTYNYSLNSSVGSMSFSAVAGSPALSSEVLSINSTTACPPPAGVPTCHWNTSLSVNKPWLLVTPASGATSLSATVSVKTTGLAAGVYSGLITAKAADLKGSTVSIPVMLTITKLVVSAPAIISQPLSQVLTSGQTASFSVSATGTATLRYQWKKNGTAISGAIGSSYTTPAESVSDNGAQFSAVVSNAAGSVTSSAATLTVNAVVVAPAVTSQPINQIITAGQTATFSVMASGSAPLTYQWRKNGAAIGATGSTYTTPAETVSDTGAQFSVLVSNAAGNATSGSAVLTVNALIVAPAITSQPLSQSITAGQTATFSVAASGTAPLSYQWNKNGAAISGATSSSYTTPVTVSSDTGSQFVATISNGAGSATSSVATLTVAASQQSYNYSLFSSVGSMTFSGVAGAAAPSPQSLSVGDTSPCPPVAGVPTCHWATVLSVDQPWLAVTPTSGTTSISASVSVNTTGMAAGVYSGNVTAAAAQLTGSPIHISVTLTITGATSAPVITSQPTSQTIASGQTASFLVASSGTAPITYQWSKNGAAISGATGSSYTTPAETVSDNLAQFTVVVSNGTGNAASSVAVLTVTAAATSTLTSTSSALNFSSVNVGSSATLGVTLTNSGSASITITGVSVNGAGFNPNGVTAGLILTAGQSATLNVAFAPAAAGDVTGSVTIASTASNATLAIALSGTGVQPVSRSVTLNWTAGDSSVTGYDVLRSTVPGGSYTQVNPGPVSAAQFTDTTVQSSQTYYYVVTAMNSSGTQSIYSNQATITIP